MMDFRGVLVGNGVGRGEVTTGSAQVLSSG